MESPVHALSGGGGILELQVRIYFYNKLISTFGSVINKRVKSLCLAAIHISHTKWLSGFHLALLPRPVLVLVLGVLNVIGEVEEDNVGEPAKHQLLYLVRNLEQVFQHSDFTSWPTHPNLRNHCSFNRGGFGAARFRYG